jgi:predicted ATPase/class 3 adenylate cyclase
MHTGVPASSWDNVHWIVERPLTTFTVLFTDIEGSTALWEEHPDAMHVALIRHDAILRASIEEPGGVVFRTLGDSFCATFDSPDAALAAVVLAQQRLAAESWPPEAVIRVRMGLHTGPCIERDGDFFGPVVNRTARLECAAHGGQSVLSEATAELVTTELLEQVELRDLGLHRLKDLGRAEHVFQVTVPGLRTDFPPLRSLENPDLPNNLPEQVTTFIGRETELTEIRALIEQARLVTLVGSGGSGKTRLALQVAAESLDGTGAGVWLVELAGVTDADLVLASMLSALGIREKPGQPLFETLVEAIGSRSILVVLDNCEHVIAEVASIVDRFLRACPQLHLLATSRETLAIDAEWTYRVPSLALPAPEDDTADALSFDAVQLFIDRARQHQPGFTADAVNLPIILDLCRRLDGIPLAIELAAVRLRSMAVADILRHLGNRFQLLTGGSRTALARQQTLRATVDWSYDLLTSDEAAVLRHLSVFAGGFTVEAAEAVCVSDTIASFSFLNILASLSDKSLVQADIGEATRYHLNETIRQYASERLAEDGSAVLPRAREAHARFYLALSELAAPYLTGGDQTQWLDVLEIERENLRVTIGLFLDDDAHQTDALRLCIALRRFWFARGYWNEGSEFLAAALGLSDGGTATPAGADRALRASALMAAGQLWTRRSMHAEAEHLFQEGLELGRSTHNDELIAESLMGIAWAAFSLGQRDDAVPLMDEALDHARLASNPQLLGVVLERRASINFGDLDIARANYAEALVYLRQAEDLFNIGIVENNLADLELILGNTENARTHLQSALAISHELRDESVMYNLVNLGHLAFIDGDLDGARDYYLGALRSSRRAGDQFMIANSVLGLAICLSAGGEDETAAQLHGITDGILAHVGGVLDVMEVRLREQDRSALRDRMGDLDFERHVQHGATHPEVDGVERTMRSIKS